MEILGLSAFSSESEFRLFLAMPICSNKLASSFLCPTCICAVKQEYMVSNFNRPFGITTNSDAHRKCFIVDIFPVHADVQ